ncbi:AprI/Inh family metalloprotease inhibitor [Brevundimonas sp. UBA7534]|uniref:AprI/Inh family metalloprotease inhibitor n=1 Tax=Brevundimonas sp. UBA7534 TaxID=1946138 RepID=UPI0025BD4D65|nr:AprI/Inh family metalloprotease inhibitor [Brevundimonas sp. UBA7534]
MSSRKITRLPEAAELAGRWRIETSTAGCDVRLTVETVVFAGPDAPALRLVSDGPWLASVDLGVIEAWRPSSDGIALLRNDGSLVVFLSRRGQGFEGSGPDGERLRLVRV